MTPATFLEIESDRVRFPAACACCDGPVAAAEALPIVRGLDVIAFAVTRSLELRLPTCEPCHRRLLGRRAAWWAGAVGLSLGAPFAALVAAIQLSASGPLGGVAIAVAAWVVAGLWWLRNRAAQALTRRLFPAWIEDASEGLTVLTVGFRRESLARDVAALSGLASEGAVLNERAGYRDPAARVPYAFVPPEKPSLAWWWVALFGVGLIVGAAAEYADLAAREREGGTIRMHVLFVLIYRLFGKAGVAGSMGALGVGGLALAARLRERQRAGGAAE